MMAPEDDRRSANRRTLDEKIAAEKELPPLQLPPDTRPLALEAHLARLRRPVAIAGVVENGVIRPLDPAIKLTEHSRVIIVTSAEP